MNITTHPVLQLVVGVHRSGTSVLTQVLSVLGLDLGRTLMLPAVDNPRGFWENSKVIEAHNRLLSALGVDWTTAAALPDNWVESEAADIAVAELSAVIETDFRADANKLVKDPRLAVLLPLWGRVAEKTGHALHVVTTFRSPKAIIDSIIRRNGFSQDDAALIVRSQLAALRNVAAPVTPPAILFERLTTLPTAMVLDALTSALPHLNIACTDAITDMVTRIILRTDVIDFSTEPDYGALIEQSGDGLFVSWAAASEFLESVKVRPADLAGRSTFLSEASSSVDVPGHRFETLKQTEEHHIKLGAEYKRLEAEFHDKTRTLQTYVKELDALSGDLSARTGQTDALDEIIQQQELLIQGLMAGPGDHADLKKSVEESKSKLAALIVDKSAIVQSAEQLSNHVDGLSAESGEISWQGDDLRREVRSLKSGLKTSLKEKQDLTERLAKVQSDLKALNETQKSLEREISNLKRNIKSAKSRHDMKLKQTVQDLDTIKTSLADAETQLATLKKREAKLKADNLEKTRSLTEAMSELGQTGGKLYEAEQNLKSTSTQLLETTRVKDMHETTIEMDGLRASMVADQYAAKIQSLESRLEYFQRAPLRAGLKSFLFSTLRSVRRGLPLPEMFKVRMAQKMTGLALRLQPPSEQETAYSLPITTDDSINFSFPEVDAPMVSIIVPVYNEISQTIACLKSIRQQQTSASYEVIVADDASPDPFHKIFDEISGLRVVRHPENLHFLLNCNRAAEHARGEYLIFLNNDTLVKEGWLENLLATFREHGNVGIAGSKLVYPTGELQEAGGIIWEDASGWNWGKGQNADHPIYNFVRDVDYISGASLMIPTALWREIGGFNEDLEKAYYEDVDLSFKVREMGYRVLYQPASVVVHIEGLSSGTDLNAGAKRYQLVNQKIFMDRWAEPLRRHLPNAQTPFLASDRTARGHILYIDAETPEPDKNAGSVNSVYAMRILVEQGYRVHFVPGSNFAYWGAATQELQRLGIECIYHPFYSNLDMFIDDRGDMFDYVIISRAESAEAYLDIIRERLPSARTVYNTVDMHFLRMQREAETAGDSEIAKAADAMRELELSFIDKADATIILSSVEEEVLLDLGVPEEKLWLIPLIRPHSERLVEFETTKDMLFIGGYKHQPNVDAVHWMMESIWPHIEAALPGVQLRICGSFMPESFNEYASDSVIVQGFVPDLDELLSQTRLTLAPLRFGAGLKGKVASSIGVGVPVVGTSMAFEGMAENGLSDVILKADDPKAFAELAVKAYTDEDVWTGISFLGVDYHNRNYAYQNIAGHYAAMLEWAKNGAA